MKNRRMFRPIKFVLFAFLFLTVFALLGWVVMGLWNWVTPALFGWKAIGYWQAVGLIALCRLLFGGFGGPRGRGGHWGRRAKERWEAMSPEEREKFRQGISGCCGHAAPPDANPTA